MRHLRYLAVALLFSLSSYIFAGCNDYGAAGVTCTGPDGYSSTIHNYGGGMSTYQDNRGNTGSIHRYEGGATAVVPQGRYNPLPVFEALGSTAQPGPSRGSKYVR